MHPQLEAVARELDEARERLRRLAATIGDSDWNRRADPDRWSVAECVAHLAITGEIYLPLIDEALGRAYARGNGIRRRMRRSFIGWTLWKTMGPPARFRSTTPARFVPAGELSRTVLLDRFDRMHEELLDRLRRADGYPIDRVRLASPFNMRVKYDLYSAFTIVARHEHRHLWQAEQVRDALRERPTREAANAAATR